MRFALELTRPSVTIRGPERSAARASRGGGIGDAVRNDVCGHRVARILQSEHVLLMEGVDDHLLRVLLDPRGS